MTATGDNSYTIKTSIGKLANESQDITVGEECEIKKSFL